MTKDELRNAIWHLAGAEFKMLGIEEQALIRQAVRRGVAWIVSGLVFVKARDDRNPRPWGSGLHLVDPTYPSQRRPNE